MNTDKCYYKKRIKEKVFNAKTGRWKTTWIEIPSRRETTPASSSDKSTRGLGPFCHPGRNKRPFTVVQVRDKTIYTDPVTKKSRCEIEHRNVKIYSDEFQPILPRNQQLYHQTCTPFTQTASAGSSAHGYAQFEGSGLEYDGQQQNQTDRPYGRRRRKLAERWTAVRPSLERAYHSSQAPATIECVLCEREEKNIFFCPDCGPMAYYCEPCLMKVHNISTLHIPMRWSGQFYIPHMWYKELRLINHHCGGTTIPSFLFLIDEKGREHGTMVHFCQCMTKAETLLLLGFWPATPKKPKKAIDLRLMEKARSFLLESANALKTFCASLKEHLLSVPTYTTEIDLYRVLSQDCATQYRSFMYNVTHLKGVVPEYPDSSECPICIKTEDILPKIVSMDGNFRLVRKKSAGVSYINPHHGSRFFVEKEEYKAYLPKELGVAAAHDEACNNFKAGSAQRSKFRSSKLDITGLFGSVCIHDYPKHFIDLEAGEKLGYAVCLINQWKDAPGGLKVLYDIACRIKPQLQKSGIDLKEIGLAVPVFHGYAHEAKCQMQYNPRLLDLYRNADGENIERLWSYLGKFTYITKEMTASNRRDLLVDALLHYGKKMIRNAGKRLDLRFRNALTAKDKAVAELAQIKQTLTAGGLAVDEEEIDAWHTQYKAHLEDRMKGSKGISWKEVYATKLNTFFSLSARLVEPPVEKDEIENKAKVQRLEEDLKKTEATHKVMRWAQNSTEYKQHLKKAQAANQQDVLERLHREAVERRHQILVKADARGHEQAAKAAKQLRETNSKINKLVAEFNVLPTVNPITFAQAKDTDSQLYESMVTGMKGPFRLMREGVIASNRIRRCEEEMTAIEVEFPALLEYQKNVHLVLEEALETADVTKGAKASIIQRLLENENEQKKTLDSFVKAIPNANDAYQIDRTFLDHSQDVIRALSNFPRKPDQKDDSNDSGMEDNDDDDDDYNEEEEEKKEDDNDAFASSDEEDNIF